MKNGLCTTWNKQSFECSRHRLRQQGLLRGGRLARRRGHGQDPADLPAQLQGGHRGGQAEGQPVQAHELHGDARRGPEELQPAPEAAGAGLPAEPLDLQRERHVLEENLREVRAVGLPAAHQQVGGRHDHQESLASPIF